MRRASALLLVLLLAGALTACGGSSGSDRSTEKGSADTTAANAGGGSSSTGSGGAASEPVEPASPEAATLAAKLLTPSDVETVSGVTGLKVVPKNPGIGAGGDINIARDDGTLFVMLNVAQGDFFALTKSGQNYGRDYPGVGDEAYAGPGKDTYKQEYLLGVRQGDYGVIVTSFLDTPGGGKPFLSLEQLQQLAEIALSRLPQ